MDTKALRQKVLDLAIRGKLVPQDPNDEPASVLLERIRQQKQQMVKEGKLKAKDIKNDSIIYVGEDNLHYEKFADGTVKCIEDEIPFELPDGWAWSRIGPLCEYITSGSRGWAQYYSDTGSLFLRMGNLSRDSFELRMDNLQRVNLPDNAEGVRTRVTENDLLFSITAEIGMLGLIPADFEEAYINQHVGLIRFLKDAQTKYFPYILMSDFCRDQYYTTQSGMKNSFRLDNIQNILAPIPPWDEQIRIAEKLRGIWVRIQQIDTESVAASDIISRAKSKILDLAVRGQLIPQDPNDEPASVLLERIRAEKEALIKAGKIKRDKKESVIFRGEDNSYYEKIGEKLSEYDVDDLPCGWDIASFSQINMFMSENVDPSNSPDEMFELYSVPNFEVGTPEIITGKEIGSSKQSVCENDVLVCKINPRINRVWITGHITPYRFLGSSEWIVFRNHLLYAPYLKYYFSSPYFRELMLSNVSGVGGSLMRAQPESVKKYPVLIPPYQEQIRITKRIDELFAALAAIEKSLR